VADLRHLQGALMQEEKAYRFERELVRLSRGDVEQIRELMQSRAYAEAAMEFPFATLDELREITDAGFTLITPGLREAVARTFVSDEDRAAAVQLLAEKYQVRASVIWTEMTRQVEAECTLEEADDLILRIREGERRADPRWHKLAGSALDAGLLDDAVIDICLNNREESWVGELEAMFPGSGATVEEISARIEALDFGAGVQSRVDSEVELLEAERAVQWTKLAEKREVSAQSLAKCAYRNWESRRNVWEVADLLHLKGLSGREPGTKLKDDFPDREEIECEAMLKKVQSMSDDEIRMLPRTRRRPPWSVKGTREAIVKWPREDVDRLASSALEHGRAWVKIQQAEFPDRSAQSVKKRWRRLQKEADGIGEADELRIARAVVSATEGEIPWGALAGQFGITVAAMMARWSVIREKPSDWFRDIVLELAVQNGGRVPDNVRVPLPRPVVAKFVKMNKPTTDPKWTAERKEKLMSLVGDGSTVKWSEVAAQLGVGAFDACAKWYALKRSKQEADEAEAAQAQEEAYGYAAPEEDEAEPVQEQEQGESAAEDDYEWT
jgi:hypothetical protein